MLLFLLFAVSVTSSASAFNTTRRLVGSNSDCGKGSRIRKSWTELTSSEIELYISAVERAIELGFHQEMVKLHVGTRNDLEAHFTCGFTLWHRRYLMGYENMLRSLGDQYACITIPFWDIMKDFSKRSSGTCSNLLDCSPILTDIGGSQGPSQTRTYSGETQSGNCFSGRPFVNYADDNGNIGCMPRSNLQNKQPPSDASYSVLFNLITRQKTYQGFTSQLEDGIHNRIHTLVSGFMVSLAAPADLLFYSWHSTIDMLHSTWHECHVAPLKTRSEKTSTWGFNAGECRRSTGNRNVNLEMGNIRVYDPIFMQSDGVNVNDHTVLGDFFSDVGATYLDFVDHRDLGDYTYGYQIPGAFREILSEKTLCPAFKDELPHDADEPLVYWEWYQKTKTKLGLVENSTPASVLQQLEYLDCLGIDESFGVVDDLGSESIEGPRLAKPQCASVLEEGSNGSVKVDKEGIPRWQAGSSGNILRSSWWIGTLVLFFVVL